MENQKSAPTGCFKCGRPGHWSRDCPSSSTPNPNPNPNLSSSSSSKFPQNSFRSTLPSSNTSSGSAAAKSGISADGQPSAKPKKVAAPRTRPKLTPQMLLSDDGLGYILRHFPRNFKYRGRGHEISDLGNLISMYSEWHSRLLPYYSFDQFVHKVEQVAATKRVKLCLGELREKVATGGDPTKLHETPVDDRTPQDRQEAMNTEEVSLHQEAPASESHGIDNIQEVMFQDIFDNATETPTGTVNNDMLAPKELPKQTPIRSVDGSGENDMTEEQKARMEANRLKAIEKAAARARALQAT